MSVAWLLLLGCWPDYPTDWDGDGYDPPEDCDPLRGDIAPGVQEIWYDGVDQDCDGASDYDADGDGYDRDVDCKDDDPAFSPGVTETWYDGEDSDCSGGSDYDADGDGHDLGDDCDDTDPAAYPGADEVWYDDVDQDCSGGSDHDADGDGAEVPEDCDDTTAEARPGLSEVCNDGLDNDCDGGAAACRLTGTTDVGAAAVQLSGVDGSFFGSSLIGGDVDGDGTAGLLVGADHLGDEASGGAYLFRGPLTDLDAAALDPDSDGVLVLEAWGSNTWAGSHAALLDVDGDGLQELALGMPRSLARGGDGAVVFARLDRTGTVALDVDDEAWVLGGGVFHEAFGSAVVGDGLGGVWIGASGHQADWRLAGGVDAYGRIAHLPVSPVEDTQLVDVADGVWMTSGEDGDGAGYQLVVIGDVDGDGLSELAIGAPDGPTLDWNTTPGCVYVVDGAESAGSFELQDVALVRLIGRGHGAKTGYTLAAPGDVDGDGLGDLVVGAPFARSEDESKGQSGAALLVTAQVLATLSGPHDLWDVATATLTSQGHGTHIGVGLGAPGDLDSDGHAELGVHAYDGSGSLSVAHVLYGPVEGGRTLADASGAPVQKGLLVWGRDETGDGDLTGAALTGGLDWTGDGIPDLALSDPLEPGSGPYAGAVYILAGSGL